MKKSIFGIAAAAILATTKNKIYAFWLINIAESKINKKIPILLIKI
jgi:hypothetical protein